MRSALYTALKLQQVKAIALGKLVRIQHCPRNGKNETAINLNLGLHHCSFLWEGGKSVIILHI